MTWAASHIPTSDASRDQSRGVDRVSPAGCDRRRGSVGSCGHGRVRKLLRRAAVCLLVGLAPGCAAFRPVDGVPARYLPDELRARSREDAQMIDLGLLRRSPATDYRVDAGDVVAVYVENILGQPESPPVNPATEDMQAATFGYPATVRDDGTLSLPRVSPIPVRGMTIPEVERAVLNAYTYQRRLLNPNSPRVVVALQQRRQNRVLVIREEAESDVLSAISISRGTVGTNKRGVSQVVDLPAYENDVLHALVESGGLPGLNAQSVVYVIRSPESQRRTAQAGMPAAGFAGGHPPYGNPTAPGYAPPQGNPYGQPGPAPYPAASSYGPAGQSMQQAGPGSAPNGPAGDAGSMPYGYPSGQPGAGYAPSTTGPGVSGPTFTMPEKNMNPVPSSAPTTRTFEFDSQQQNGAPNGQQPIQPQSYRSQWQAPASQGPMAPLYRGATAPVIRGQSPDVEPASGTDRWVTMKTLSATSTIQQAGYSVMATPRQIAEHISGIPLSLRRSPEEMANSAAADADQQQAIANNRSPLAYGMQHEDTAGSPLQRPETVHFDYLGRPVGPQISLPPDYQITQAACETCQSPGGMPAWQSQPMPQQPMPMMSPQYGTMPQPMMAQPGQMPAQNWVPPALWSNPDQIQQMVSNGCRENQVIRIPLRVTSNDMVQLSERDIVLNDGDIVFIGSRDDEVFYTSGLLGGGEYTLPRDRDIDILKAIAIAEAGARSGQSAGRSALNSDVSISPSQAIVLRRLPNNTQVPILVDLYRARQQMSERIIIQPGDHIILQYTTLEAVGAFFERHILESALFGVAASQMNQNRR